MLLFILSGEHLDLAQAEAEAHAGEGTRHGKQFLVDATRIPTCLALTREIHELIADDIDYAALIPGSFIVRTHDGSDPCKQARPIWTRIAQVREPHVAPSGTEIHIFPGFRTILRWRNTEPFAARRSHLRAANHPSSLSPKLARAMINLAPSAQTILDPYCGSGGILIEGALLGRSMIGRDIDPRQIQRAQANLEKYGLTARLSVGDARALEGDVDAIVTDLPFARNTRRVGRVEEFLKRASLITNRLVIAHDAPVAHDAWSVDRAFTWPLHRSLTKHVAILTRRASSGDR